ncbi:MAG: Gfo/Idh/MocA family oxidoreductase [Planctomycetota bacterium]
MLRRDFLSRMTAAGLGAAAIPTRLRADEPNAPAAPRDVIRMAFAGVRGRGSDLMKEWAKMKDVQIVAIADPDENVLGKAMKVAADAGGQKPAYEKDIRKILDDKSIDAVVVATPNHWHSLASIWALQAGKHVYCEKPISHNYWEGARLVEAAKKYNRVCVTGTQRRSSAAIASAIAYMQAGKLGRVKVGRGIYYGKRASIGKKPDAAVPVGVDYNLWQGPAAEHAFNPNRFHYEWHWNWEYGGGDLANNGVHYLDVIRWGLNKNELPKRSLSLGGRYLFNDDGVTPNTQLAWYDYGDCQMMCEIRNFVSEPYRVEKPGVIFECENGYLVADGTTHAAFDLKWNKIETFTGGSDHYRRFIDACKKGSLDTPENHISQGHLTTAVCHIGNISYRTAEERPFDGAESLFKDNPTLAEAYGRLTEHLTKSNVDLKTEKIRIGKALEFDAKTETFPGDAKATALLRREYRAPFSVPEKV